MWNIYLLSFSPHWFHVNRKLPTWCLRVFVFFICIFFILLEGTIWIWVCWSVFSKCRYVISSHSNHWDHTELYYHVSICRSVHVVFNWWWGLKKRKKKKQRCVYFLSPLVLCWLTTWLDQNSFLTHSFSHQKVEKSASDVVYALVKTSLPKFWGIQNLLPPHHARKAGPFLRTHSFAVFVAFQTYTEGYTKHMLWCLTHI